MRRFRSDLWPLLIFACSRIILPFTGILLWSVILAVMLYPLAPTLGRPGRQSLVGDVDRVG